MPDDLRIVPRNPYESTQWCIGMEAEASCANCYRPKCEKRASQPSVDLPSATSLGQVNFNCGRRRGGKPKGDA
jgi:hypothetical protein